MAICKQLQASAAGAYIISERGHKTLSYQSAVLFVRQRQVLLHT
jgi:hypothetical protein